MTKGVLLFCFDTSESKYHKILERCVDLIKKNIGVPITVVTDFDTFKKIKPMGFVNYKLIQPEIGNTLLGKEWKNCDRHMAYELSPYDKTLVLDIDYFCFTDNLKSCFDTQHEFLVTTRAHDLAGLNSFDLRRFSMIPMVWATVLYFRKTEKVKKIFQTVKYVKDWYQYFVELYRINGKNFRNDYAFAIALKQINGFTDYEQFPFAIPTLPRACEITEISDRGLSWKYQDQIGAVQDQDVHVLNKEVANV